MTSPSFNRVIQNSQKTSDLESVSIVKLKFQNLLIATRQQAMNPALKRLKTYEHSLRLQSPLFQ